MITKKRLLKEYYQNQEALETTPYILRFIS